MTQEKPLVSIRLMVYNNENDIQDTIEGILIQQVKFPVEVVVGDDFSTDNTLKIINSYNDTEKIIIRILDRPVGGEYWHKRKNKNASVRTNFMDIVENCRGKYIALLDGDDYWTDPLKLQKQVDFMEGNPEYVGCFHLCEILREDLQGQKKKLPLNRIKYDYTIKNLLSYWNIPTASIVFRNTEPLNFPSWFVEVASGDIALMMLLFEKGKFKLLEEYMSVYRISGKGVSVSHSNYRMIHYRAVLYSHLNEYFNYKYEKEIYDALNYIYLKFSGIEKPKIPKKRQSLAVRIKKKIVRRIKLILK